ncbi:MAG: hypothetical protein EKK71_08625 [Candidatus Competibacteraceae bacterium]|nr:MAG: hypothetical protein EKK71_08625 [Candidatus Competibacteraceae bacterium]
MALLLAVLMFPAHAQQISDAKVEALVEALRLSAPKPGPNGGLYSDWQVKPDNITRWSKRCLNQEVTPEQFAADQALARQILACVMGKVLREQVAAGNNEIVAVQRSAAWWMTGDPEQYNSGSTSAYTLRVLEAYLRFF